MDTKALQDMTMEEHAEAWQLERGRIVATRGTLAWQVMYEEWIVFAFDL